MNLDREVRGDVHVLTPRKNLQGGEETQELRRAVEEIAAAGTPPRIVVDLGKVSFMNSVGLGVLVGAHTTCARRDGWLRVARIGSRITNLFLVTKLTLVFDSFDSVDEALAGINQSER